MHTLTPARARAMLSKMQSRPTGKPDAAIEDLTLPIGPRGTVRVRIVRPQRRSDALAGSDLSAWRRLDAGGRWVHTTA